MDNERSNSTPGIELVTSDGKLAGVVRRDGAGMWRALGDRFGSFDAAAEAVLAWYLRRENPAYDRRPGASRDGAGGGQCLDRTVRQTTSHVCCYPPPVTGTIKRRGNALVARVPSDGKPWEQWIEADRERQARQRRGKRARSGGAMAAALAAALDSK